MARPVVGHRPLRNDRRVMRDGLVRPFLIAVAIGGTAVRWPGGGILHPRLALPLFVLASIVAVAELFPWTRLTQPQLAAGMTVDMLLGALLLPLVHQTTGALFAYTAAAAVGWRLASRRTAMAVAAAGSVVAAAATWLAARQAPGFEQWSWWVALTVGLPVYIGMSNRDRLNAVRSARRAAEQAQRAAESEARAAALVERGRIAREIHDVLGHSLSGIAMQLDMADGLHESGREAEAAAAVRRARALAVDSIGETRRAVQALREDTLPLPETLRRMAEGSTAAFELTGTPEPLGAEATHALVRAAQEALTNVAKYAPGATVTVRLAFSGDRTTLTVTNTAATGTRRPELADGTGTGLVGMRERVALLGGTLRAGPAGDGWTVEAEIPR
ncbi:two-component sensor histidine kinase [Nocardia terpenica]|uniref:sensor histidine kinase n=1 Tax=Nocardia terpenica TaxID=455432 RepID=UPI001894518B|nr:histidine kinase [Nocardia terpenica]MBF6063321.1 two-component sensor histidine kinase [Nocardia terpenica]MBF6105877.1 two-component sensor histidine kinase [Nocardia terpenica]MBF6113539.1 two-component sensor histidine kinase [Nocardia terpenica]MBF6119618.1 two-component sensor histidine kinase [Nocardia terpenica]MBF6152029.1 two-component sensor histidine kinase [Nocardia terpenica]